MLLQKSTLTLSFALREGTLYYRFWEKRDPVFAAILFQSCTGLRIGELAALRWSDIRGNKLHVHSEEVYERQHGDLKRMYHIVPHTKTYADREIYLSKEARAVLGYLVSHSLHTYLQNHILKSIFTVSSTNQTFLDKPSTD